MVHHRMRSRSRGSRGGHGRQQAARSVNPAHNLTPYHGFQTTHFTFQSNLNRPVITANITILFSEEEASPRIRVRLMSEPPQEAFKEANSESKRQVTTGESQEKGQGERRERSEAPSASRPPETAVSRIWEEIDRDMHPLMSHLGDENVGHEDAWEDKACPVVEEPQHEDATF